LYSVTEAGGQDQFIDPAGHGTPHLTDQVMMHVEGRFKPIAMDPLVVAHERMSSVTLRYQR
jgi:hypothetical protein